MGIQLSGYNSGMPVNDIITQLLQIERRPLDLLEQRQQKINLQKANYANVEDRIKSLFASIEKITKRSVADGSSVFSSMSAKSTDDAIATATATKNTSPQTINLEVKKLPTQTKAVSTNLVGEFDNNTTVDELGITPGFFTFYVDGVEETITVNAGDTMGVIFGRINAATNRIDSNPTIVNGKITINYDSGASIQLGAGGDTSNFLAITHLNTGIDNGTNQIVASQANTTIRLDQPVSSGAANINTNVVDGTFRINGVTFDTTGKTLQQIMDEINASSANVTASFNMGTNKFELKAKDTGSTLIHLEDDTNSGGLTSNFLTAMGLITGGGNPTTSQTAGDNAEFVINGTTFYSTTTVVDETVHGITGLTLNLKKATPGTTVQITVAQDKDTLKADVKDFIDKFNAAISYIDEQTNAENKGVLAGERSLIRLRNDLRSMLSSSVAGLSGTAYDSLQMVGIGTASSVGGKASPTIIFDESKFDAALAADPEAVRKLFIGIDHIGTEDGADGDDNADGVFTRLGRMLDDSTYTIPGGSTSWGALYNGPSDSEKGMFAAYQLSAANRIEDLNKAIERGEERLLRKEQLLRQQFLAMERLIGQFNSQGSALTGLQQQLNAGK